MQQSVSPPFICSYQPEPAQTFLDLQHKNLFHDSSLNPQYTAQNSTHFLDALTVTPIKIFHLTSGHSRMGNWQHKNMTLTRPL